MVLCSVLGLGFSVWWCIELAVLFEIGDLLEVERVDQSEELLDGLLEIVVDEAVGEEDRVVGGLDLRDGELNPLLELLLRLNAVSNSLPQVLKAGRIDEQEVTLDAVLINLQRALRIDLDDGNSASGADSLQLLLARAVEVAGNLFPLDKVSGRNFLQTSTCQTHKSLCIYALTFSNSACEM